MTDLDGTRHSSSDDQTWRRQPRPADPASPEPGRPEPAGAATAGPGGRSVWSGQSDPARMRDPARAADLLPSVSLPRSGGAIRGLDEKFSVNAATGTASMTIRLPFSPGRSGRRQRWSSATTRARETGRSASAGAWGCRRSPARPTRACRGTAMPTSPTSSSWPARTTWCRCSTRPAARKTKTRTVHGTPYQIAFYRPRIEGLFSRIERWTAAAPG